MEKSYSFFAVVIIISATAGLGLKFIDIARNNINNVQQEVMGAVYDAPICDALTDDLSDTDPVFEDIPNTNTPTEDKVIEKSNPTVPGVNINQDINVEGENNTVTVVNNIYVNEDQQEQSDESNKQ